MNIGFLTPEYPHAKTGNSGGIGTSVQNLGQSLSKEGHHVYVYVYGQMTDDEFNDGNVVVKQICNRRFKGISWWLTRKKIERIINEDIRKLRLDIVEVPDWTGISAWMRIDVPVVMRLNGSDTFFCHLEKRPVKWWNSYQERTAYLNADGIIAVSNFVGKETNNIFNTSRTYSVIHNGIQTSLFRPASVKATTPVILYFGTLIRKKGVMELPYIFNKVHEQNPDTQLILIGADASDIATGSPSTWEIMKNNFSASAFSQVTYLGKVPYTNIISYIEQASVCVFPSFAEACPVSWLEAMAMKKAIVASNVGWASELIDHEKSGLLCAPEDHELFARSILSILNDNELRDQMGTNARKRCVTIFDSSVIAQQSISYYTSIIHGT